MSMSMKRKANITYSLAWAEESRLLDAVSHQDKHWSSGGETKLFEISPACLKAN